MPDGPDPARRSERARTAILDAARTLTLERGFERLTVDGIAARAGVGKQTIYRWWPSKGAVLFDALLRVHAGHGPALPDTGDLRADLRTVLHAIVDEFADPATDRLQRVVAAAIQSDETLATELADRLLRPQLDATQVRLTRAREAGQLPADADVRTLTETLYGPILYRWLLRLGPLDHAHADRVLAHWLPG